MTFIIYYVSMNLPFIIINLFFMHVIYSHLIHYIYTHIYTHMYIYILHIHMQKSVSTVACIIMNGYLFQDAFLSDKLGL